MCRSGKTHRRAELANTATFSSPRSPQRIRFLYFFQDNKVINFLSSTNPEKFRLNISSRYFWIKALKVIDKVLMMMIRWTCQVWTDILGLSASRSLRLIELIDISQNGLMCLLCRDFGRHAGHTNILLENHAARVRSTLVTSKREVEEWQREVIRLQSDVQR